MCSRKKYGQEETLSFPVWKCSEGFDSKFCRVKLVRGMFWPSGRKTGEKQQFFFNSFLPAIFLDVRMNFVIDFSYPSSCLFVEFNNYQWIASNCRDIIWSVCSHQPIWKYKRTELIKVRDFKWEAVHWQCEVGIFSTGDGNSAGENFCFLGQEQVTDSNKLL